MNIFRFSVNKWLSFRKSNEIPPIEMKLHKNGWQLGGHWMDNPVSFEFIKITYNPEMDKDNTVSVRNRQIYMPVLSIQKDGDPEKEEFRFRVTEFMTVIAYQVSHVFEILVTFIVVKAWAIGVKIQFFAFFEFFSQKRQIFNYHSELEEVLKNSEKLEEILKTHKKCSHFR